MKPTSILAFCVVLFAAALPCFGQGNACSPVGSWWGGADLIPDGYLALFTPRPVKGDPLGANHYTMTFHGAYSPESQGLFATTLFSGPLDKKQTGEYEYEGTGVALANTKNTFPGEVIIIAARFRFKFDGCDTLKDNIDFFGGYFMGNGKVPFKDVPDFEIAPTPITETYHRVTTDCPACPTP